MTSDREEQGLDVQLTIPISFETGGGAQIAGETLRIYADCVGELNIHLLENCAMSIGR